MLYVIERAQRTTEIKAVWLYYVLIFRSAWIKKELSDWQTVGVLVFIIREEGEGKIWMNLG